MGIEQTTSSYAVTGIEQIQKNILREMFIALGVGENRYLKWLLRPLFLPPASRFARLAADIEETAARNGLPAACRMALSRFVTGIQVNGASQIPSSGPLIIAGNHPGVYDSVAIVAQIPRNDIKIVVSGIPLLHEMRYLKRHFIFSSENVYERMSALREALRHIQSGGSLLIFPSGVIDPDPSLVPGAEKALESWSGSLGVILHNHPETQITPVFTSGVLDPTAYNHPISRMRRTRYDRQKLAEFFMMARLLVLNRQYASQTRISFGSPLRLPPSAPYPDAAACLAMVISHAKDLFHTHRDFLASEKIPIFV